MMTAASQWYGIEWDSTNPSPACTRIGRKELHVLLPIQSRMRRCVLRDDGSVAYYLHESDSTLREDGRKANLDGSDGMVMVEIPAHYRRFETIGTRYRCMLSEQPLAGFRYVPTAYRSAYEATVDRTDPAAPKLASVVNTTAAFRGGGNNPAWDGTYRTLLGRPASMGSLTDFRTFARNRGTAGMNGACWNCDVYEIQKTCWWLYAVEYANFNSQLAYNAALTADGCRQGGLGLGVTTFSAWPTYNTAYPFVPCGHTDSLGNHTGVVDYALPDSDGGVFATLPVPSYRGLENPFGHLWSWTDGCKCRIQSDAAGGLCELFVCSDPALFQDIDYTGYEKRGELPRTGGFVKVMILGETGENMPSEIGASATTYFSDMFRISLPTSGEDQKGMQFGGTSNSSTTAGLSAVSVLTGATGVSSPCGTRLCFIP